MMARVRVLIDTLEHDGQRLLPGNEIELDAGQANTLAELGAVALMEAAIDAPRRRPRSPKTQPDAQK